LRQLLGEEPRVLHHVPNTLTLVAAGTGLALVPGSLETINIPDIAHRPPADFPVRCDLVLAGQPKTFDRRMIFEWIRKAGPIATMTRESVSRRWIADAICRF
jgi:hypothetical protein